MQRSKWLERTFTRVFLALALGVLGWAALAGSGRAAPALEEQHPTVFARRPPLPAAAVRADFREELASLPAIRKRVSDIRIILVACPSLPALAGRTLLNLIGLRRE